jgi:soluble lytic murein transglycosylase
VVLRSFRLFLSIILLTGLVFLPYQLVSAGTANASENIRSAFRYIERKDWDNAIAHAKKSGEAGLVTLATHQYLLDNDSNANFSEYVKFIEAHPDWPDQKKLRIRAEMSLKDGNVRDHDLIAWFDDETPITGVGKMALVEAYKENKMGSDEKIAYLVRDAWRNGDFDEDQERKIQSEYAKLLREDDYIGRIDRLLWEEKTSAAKRILGKVPDAHQKLFRARIDLIDKKGSSTLSVAQVPSSLKHDAGLIYDRMRYRIKRDDTQGVREMLLLAPEHPPYPEKWWKAREYQVHKAINDGDYTMAYKLLKNHGQVDGPELADAKWLLGWLQCEFLKKPKDAYHTFYDMFKIVRFPVSKARAAYWAAHASEKAGDKSTASSWYNTASAYPTTFYGQVAAFKKFGTAPLHIPAPHNVSDSERRAFERSHIGQAIKISLEYDKPEIASKLINHVAETAVEGKEHQALIAAEMGKKSYAYTGVRGAKKALQQNIVLLNAGYPTPKTPSDIGIERPLVLAITRQESEYDPRARSPANAMGLMQLLSSTAKEVARKNKLSFSKDKLYDPSYNMTLGSLYLESMINNYDGSYVMAIAAYNAGPGNVRNWANKFGTPGHNVDRAINWIESIPFAETRNYVQRVLENLQVYRYIEANGNSPKLLIGEDLAR